MAEVVEQPCVFQFVEEARKAIRDRTLADPERLAKAKNLLRQYLNSRSGDSKEALRPFTNEPHLREAAIPLWNELFPNERLALIMM